MAQRCAGSPRRLIAFVALAYGISWAWWIPLVATGAVVDPGQAWPTHLPGLLGPAIAAVLVTGATEGRAGIARLWSRIVRWRVRWYWYGLVAGTVAVAALPLVVGDRPDAQDFAAYSGAPMAGLWIVPYVLLVNGFGEEIGWRGYLADGLLDTRSRATAALLVWPVWALWHLPLFWVVGNLRGLGVGGTAGWLVGIGFGSVVLTWLYDSASRSILLVALWHTAYNFTTATEASAGIAAAVSSTVVMVGGVVILALRRSRRRPAPLSP